MSDGELDLRDFSSLVVIENMLQQVFEHSLQQVLQVAEVVSTVVLRTGVRIVG